MKFPLNIDLQAEFSPHLHKVRRRVVRCQRERIIDRVVVGSEAISVWHSRGQSVTLVIHFFTSLQLSFARLIKIYRRAFDEDNFTMMRVHERKHLST
jgi:hypothetical protein